MNPKIALCMIAKDKADIITRVLDSTKAVFDLYCLQDTGSTDDTIKVFKKWCQKHSVKSKISQKFVGKDYKAVVVEGRQVLGDFGKARQDSFKLAKGCDFAFWIDTDDILVGAEHIRPLATGMAKEGIDMAIMTYVYARGEDGLKPVVQKRERLINLNKKGQWRDRVHETYEIEGQVKLIEVQEVSVEHLRSPYEAVSTARRNNMIMTNQLQEDGLERFSDKMLHNLAFDHWEHREFPQAIKYYKLLIKRHGDKIPVDLGYSTTIKIAQAYLGMNKLEKAIVHGLRAKRLKPSQQDSYIVLAQAYATIGSWEEASMCASKILQLGVPNTTAPINEYEYLILPRKILQQGHLIKGEFDQALAMADGIIQISPMAVNKQEKTTIQKEIATQRAVKGVVSLARYIQTGGDIQMLDRLKTAIPLELKDVPIIRSIIKEITADYNRKANSPRFKGKKSIVLYAGQHFEPWDGNSDKEKGIGGSEGMTIQLMRELAALGNDVVVYNECGQSAGKVFDGVKYEHWSKWNENLKSDIFISLRNPSIFGKMLRATKQYLWLHDTEYGNLDSSLFYAPNKVIVLSEFHRQIIKENHGITNDEIFWQTRNGINSEAVKYGDKNATERNPYQIIYASSYDRGLDNLLNMWPKIKEAVPEATCKIFYGWNTYDAMMNMRANTPYGQHMARYKSDIIEAIGKLDGVQELGRISQNDLYKEFRQSGVWFYPTRFQEISCINAITAQAMGAIPVCTPFAALNETVSSKYGVKAELNEIADALIYTLKNPDEAKRKEMMEWARKEYDMKELAKSWDLMFNNNYGRLPYKNTSPLTSFNH